MARRVVRGSSGSGTSPVPADGVLIQFHDRRDLGDRHELSEVRARTPQA